MAETLKNSESLVYRCRIFDVYEADVKLPNGRLVKQTRIEHKPTIAVVPIDEKGNLILLNQFRSALNRNLLEIPAGSLDTEESIEACVQRELAEEAGYQADRLIKLFEGYLVPGYCNEYMHFFLALDLFEKSLPPDEDEVIEIVRIPFDEALCMIERGEIVDAKTALGIVLARNYLSQSK